MGDSKTEGRRGMLRRICKRIIDPDTRRQTCTLECGHVVVRAAGGSAERSYCTECAALPGRLPHSKCRDDLPSVGGTRAKKSDS